jgi:hypothetical protein
MVLDGATEARIASLEEQLDVLFGFIQSWNEVEMEDEASCSCEADPEE